MTKDQILQKTILHWEKKAENNIEKWGKQDKETLALCMTEELGELAQAILQYNELPPTDDEIGYSALRYNNMCDELDDLAALCIQMSKCLRGL